MGAARRTLTNSRSGDHDPNSEEDRSEEACGTEASREEGDRYQERAQASRRASDDASDPRAASREGS
jgi:hypothetical protein